MLNGGGHRDWSLLWDRNSVARSSLLLSACYPWPGVSHASLLETLRAAGPKPAQAQSCRVQLAGQMLQSQSSRIDILGLPQLSV